MNETKRYWDLLDWSKEELVNHIIDLEKYSNEDKKEHSVYAIKFASQQMLIDKLQNNWNELKKWLEEKMSVYEHKEASNFYVVFEKMQELQGDDKN